MIIRKAKTKDISVIVELWKGFMKDFNDKFSENKTIKDYITLKKNAGKDFRKFAEEKIKSKDGKIFIVEEGNEPIGYMLIYIKKTIPIYKLKKIGYISDLFIKKEFRRRGISSKLKKKAISWFKKKGMKHMSIQVYADNKIPYDIYKKWGFSDFHIELRKKI